MPLPRLPQQDTPPAAGPQPVLPSRQRWPLWDAVSSRRIEAQALAVQPQHTLMERAGLGLARLALAVAPQARRIWVAAGPGNNGGDGLVAARWLHAQGLAVQVSLLGDAARQPADAQCALAQARQSGVTISTSPGSTGFEMQPTDLAIDALLGLGGCRAPDGAIALAVQQLNAGRAPVLAVDLPTGLCGDTGQRLGEHAVRAAHTLALLTLKPGLFTALGRDHAGRVWLDTLGVASSIDRPGQGGVAGLPSVPALPGLLGLLGLPSDAATAWLLGPESLHALLPLRAHAQHKGSFGDVLVLGGAPGMAGAALLAARAALRAGAGRVYLARLDGNMQPDAQRPELMPSSLAQALDPARLAQATVVCGCGGGAAVQAVLPAGLAFAARLVLDADALNAVAADPALQQALAARAAASHPTVLTPHPLEAARLLGCTTQAVQANRLASASTLAAMFQATVVLKGSGTVIAHPGRPASINPTGNARLGTPGSGDVLAGWLGGLWAQATAQQGFEAACAAVWLHGKAAEVGDRRRPLLANDLIGQMAWALPGDGAVSGA